MKEVTLEKVASALEEAADTIAQKDETIQELQGQVSKLLGEKEELSKTASTLEEMATGHYDEMGTPADVSFDDPMTGSDMLDSFLSA